MRKEYAKLHDRYTELFKTHMDYMERTKILLGTDRLDQLDHMAGLVDELYPSFRLVLFDQQAHYSIPYTVFGPYRAAIYVGGMYLVLNATATVQALTRHFDGLIRAATVHAHEIEAFTRSLRRLVR